MTFVSRGPITFVFLRGRRGTWRHPPSLVALPKNPCFMRARDFRPQPFWFIVSAESDSDSG